MQTFAMPYSTAQILTWGTDPDDAGPMCENPTCTSTINVLVPESIYELAYCEACRILFGTMAEVLDIANTYDYPHVRDELQGRSLYSEPTPDAELDISVEAEAEADVAA